MSPRRWRPTPLLWLTFILHLGLVLLLIWQPDSWRTWLAILAANHLLLTGIGLWPRSQALGPNWRRLPEPAASAGLVAITFDDGPDPAVTPQVLDLLDRYQARATFFCIGAQAERHPELCREIIRRGHAVENHSQHHRHLFSTFGPARMAREIDTGQRTLTRISGQQPLFFRPTAGLRNPFLDYLLARRGLTLASWTRRGFDTRCSNADKVARRLLRQLAAGDILLLHDGHAAHTTDGTPIVLAVLPQVLDAAAARGLRCVTLRSTLATAVS
ncbi:MAG: polysaccharide deacetylase family protein [Pseudomonadota bacterium]